MAKFEQEYDKTVEFVKLMRDDKKNLKDFYTFLLINVSQQNRDKILAMIALNYKEIFSVEV